MLEGQESCLLQMQEGGLLQMLLLLMLNEMFDTFQVKLDCRPALPGLWMLR